MEYTQARSHSVSKTTGSNCRRRSHGSGARRCRPYDKKTSSTKQQLSPSPTVVISASSRPYGFYKEQGETTTTELDHEAAVAANKYLYKDYVQDPSKPSQCGSDNSSDEEEGGDDQQENIIRMGGYDLYFNYDKKKWYITKKGRHWELHDKSLNGRDCIYTLRKSAKNLETSYYALLRNVKRDVTLCIKNSFLFKKMTPENNYTFTNEDVHNAHYDAVRLVQSKGKCEHLRKCIWNACSGKVRAGILSKPTPAVWDMLSVVSGLELSDLELTDTTLSDEVQNSVVYFLQCINAI